MTNSCISDHVESEALKTIKTMHGCLNHTEPWSLVVKELVHSKITSLSLYTQPYVMFSGLASSNMKTEYNTCDLYSLDRLLFFIRL